MVQRNTACIVYRADYGYIEFSRVKKNRKTIYRSDVEVAVISDVYSPFILNNTSLTKCCFTQWILNQPRSFEIHRVKHPQLYFMVLSGIRNVTVYKTEPIFTGVGHG